MLPLYCAVALLHFTGLWDMSEQSPEVMCFAYWFVSWDHVLCMLICVPRSHASLCVLCLLSCVLDSPIVLSCIYRLQVGRLIPQFLFPHFQVSSCFPPFEYSSYSPTCSPLGALSLKGPFRHVFQQVMGPGLHCVWTTRVHTLPTQVSLTYKSFPSATLALHCHLHSSLC